MKRHVLIGILAGVMLATLGTAAPDDGTAARADQAKPVNAMCPIGKAPIVPSAGTVVHEGHTIGLCCPSCGEAFLAWDETRRDAFVQLAMAGEEPGQAHPEAPGAGSISKPAATSQPAAPMSTSYPYPLDVCVVSGEALGSMGDPIIKIYEGREVRLCCNECVGEFESKPDEFWKQVDAKIIDAQLMHYPIDTCIVSGGKLGSMGDPVNLVYNNRLVRFCCAGCPPKFTAKPDAFLAALDKQIIERQMKDYPLDTCVVSGESLGSMGEPIDYIYGNRLVRLCCSGCTEGFEASPASYVAKLDAAYADAQRDAYPIDTCVVGGGPLGSMGEPVEVVAGTTLVRFCCAGCLPTFAKDPATYLAKVRAK